MTDAERVNDYPSDWTTAQVVAAECDHYGLPHSIDALLRHVYNNRDMHLGVKDHHIELLEERLRDATN